MTLANATPYAAEFNITRRMQLSHFRPCASALLKFTSTELLVFNGPANRLLANGLMESTQSLIADEVELGSAFFASSDHIDAISTLSVTTWRASKLRCFATEHPQRVLEPSIARQLTRLQFSLPAFDCRSALDALLSGNPQLSLYLELTLNRGTPPYWLWREYLFDLAVGLYRGEVTSFVRRLWLRTLVAFFGELEVRLPGQRHYPIPNDEDISIRMHQLNDHLSLYSGLRVFDDGDFYGEVVYFFFEPSSEPEPCFDDWMLQAPTAAYYGFPRI